MIKTQGLSEYAKFVTEKKLEMSSQKGKSASSEKET